MPFQLHLTRLPRLTLSVRGLKRKVSTLVPLMTTVFLGCLGAGEVSGAGDVVLGVRSGDDGGAGDVVVGVVGGYVVTGGSSGG